MVTRYGEILALEGEIAERLDAALGSLSPRPGLGRDLMVLSLSLHEGLEAEEISAVLPDHPPPEEIRVRLVRICREILDTVGC